MPVNYAQVENSLDYFAEQSRTLMAEKAQNARRVNELFSAAAGEQAVLAETITRAEQQLANLYTAKPTDEAIIDHKPLPALPEKYTLVAADGSQIAPDRHRALQFCVINVGLIKANIGSGSPPEVQVISQLLDQNEIFSTEGSLIGDDEVALHRDLAERQILLEACSESEQSPIITLTDGPLDVFYRSTLEGQRRQQIQKNVALIEKTLQQRGVISAGYIDKPGSEMINRMLDIYEKARGSETIKYDQKQRACKGVSDATLLTNLLQIPGERSAIFEAVTKHESNQSENVKVSFFYLNVSSNPESAYLVRVEFPAWVAKYPQKIDLLHAVIYADAQVLDAHPYPYLLHRAHELAVVKMIEADEVENMLLQKLGMEHLPGGQLSNKQANKGLIKR